MSIEHHHHTMSISAIFSMSFGVRRWCMCVCVCVWLCQCWKVEMPDNLSRTNSHCAHIIYILMLIHIEAHLYNSRAGITGRARERESTYNCAADDAHFSSALLCGSDGCTRHNTHTHTPIEWYSSHVSITVPGGICGCRGQGEGLGNVRRYMRTRCRTHGNYVRRRNEKWKRANGERNKGKHSHAAPNMTE